jgi:hypothetical protein
LTTERTHLINAVLTTRDKIDADLDTELLEAIVDAEANHPEDSDQAMRVIETAVSEAIARGVGAPALDAPIQGGQQEEEES